MNSIHDKTGMSSPCVCLIMRLLCIDKSITTFSFMSILFQSFCINTNGCLHVK